MSEDPKQLSVAELLARNGQQGASASGGGRRRRSGRGISVAELTGDLPVIPSGGGRSSHAAPDDEPAYEPTAYEPTAYEPTAYEPTAYEPTAYEPTAYEPTAYEPTAYEPTAYEPTAYEPTAYDAAGYQPSAYELPPPESGPYALPEPAPELPAYSPMSGPITRYDPLSPYAQPESDPLPNRSNRVLPGSDPPASRHAAPADPLSAPAPYTASYAPAPDRFAPDPLAADGASALDSGRTGRRRRRAEPEEETTDVRPSQDLGSNGRPFEYGSTGTAPPEHNGSANGRYGPAADSLAPPSRTGARPSRAERRRAEERAEEAAVGPSTAPWSAQANGFAPESEPLPRQEPPARHQPPRGHAPSRAVPDQGRAPEWGQRPDPGRIPESEPQRRAFHDGGRGPADGALPTWSARRHKPSAPDDFDQSPESGALPASAWSLASQDQQLLSGQTVAGDLLRDGVQRAERADAQRSSTRTEGKRGRSAAKSRFGRAPVDMPDPYEGATDIYEDLGSALAAEHDDDPDFDDHDADSSGFASISPRRSRIARKSEYDANRKQWMILGGQSAGAAVAGMLLFKGFERMWEMLPWVALALAMIVILGLVALVRILRRTDDILSTVIAVVVGIFVTLGPLAFLLSTN